jgi:hypothetical protein
MRKNTFAQQQTKAVQKAKLERTPKQHFGFIFFRNREKGPWLAAPQPALQCTAKEQMLPPPSSALPAERV